MLFNYRAIDATGASKTGSIEAGSMDIAISALQKRGLILSNIDPADTPFSIRGSIPFLNKVSGREVVILSRQISTLFTAQVSALQVFKLLAAEAENPALAKSLAAVADDIQGGSSISRALAVQKDIFSSFYVNMVRAGEESGKLDEAFGFLAEYLDRSYEIANRVRNALVYPLFVVMTFIVVMALMFTMVIPKISTILTDSGLELPIYTRIVLSISDFFVNYIAFILILLAVCTIFFVRFVRTKAGKTSVDRWKLSIPYVGTLYKKLYLSRIADNIQTMTKSGIPMVKAIEITSTVVDNEIFRGILLGSSELVRTGSSFSASLSRSEEIPGIMVQMIKVGEETGELGNILGTLGKFYQREVVNAVDTLISMIEPAMVVLLGAGVGVLLASVLMPIYNMATSLA